MRLLSVIASILFFVSCSAPQEEVIEKVEMGEEQVSIMQTVIEESAKKGEVADSVLVKELATTIIYLLKDKKLSEVAEYIHPESAMLFSPYAYVSEESYVFSKSEYLALIVSSKKYSFGVMSAEDGGDEELTFDEYFNRFVYNVDYTNAPQIAYNQFLGFGNSLNNLKEFFPNAHFVEYYFPGFDEKYDGMDWQTLRLVFQEYEGQFYLIAIVHDQWTI